jgi:hypothetical protein
MSAKINIPTKINFLCFPTVVIGEDTSSVDDISVNAAIWMKNKSDDD